MSDTPRTDIATRDFGYRDESGMWIQQMLVGPDFARQLERENAELIAALNVLVGACDTGHRNDDGGQMGVRTPEKSAVEFARSVLIKTRP